MEGQNQTEGAKNPKMAVVTPKNQIDFFMNSYAVYKKSGVVVIEVFFQTPKGNVARFFELTAEEIEADEFRTLANAIRKNPDQYSQREIL